MASNIDLVSAALVLIGDKPINTLTGNSRSQLVASALYDGIINYELSRHTWGFARAKAQISRTTSVSIDNEYESIYQLPSGMIRLIKITPRVSYQIYGDKLYTNLSQALYCDYIYTVPETEYPYYFSKMIEYALAKDFAASIRDSDSLRDGLTREYLSSSAQAMAIDSQQHPQTAIVSSPFITARR